MWFSHLQQRELVNMNKTVILVTRQGLGTTLPEDAEFGLEMLGQVLPRPGAPAGEAVRDLFLHGSVELLVPDSTVVLGLQLLEKLGVRILACQTCVNQYRLQNQLAVGEVERTT